MRISVVMSVHNGLPYLTDQLRTIAEQTRPTEEIIVRDDASHDGSIHAVQEAAATWDLPLRLVESQLSLGPAAGFEACMRMATGEVIVLADQDDLWSPDRLAVTEAIFSRDETLEALFCDADLVDAEGRPLGRRLWQEVGFSPGAAFRGESLRYLSRRNVVSGTTLAVRASLRDLALPWPDGWMHDAWLALLAAARGSLEALPQPLVSYRIHDGQYAGLTPNRGRPDVAARRLRRRARLLEDAARRIDADPDHELWSAAQHLHTRAAVITRKEPVRSILDEAVSGRYSRVSGSLRPAVGDLLRRRRVGEQP